MGAKVLILKVVSHNNRLKDLKLKLKVSNMSSRIFHDKTKMWFSRPIMFSQKKLNYNTFANIVKKILIIVFISKILQLVSLFYDKFPVNRIFISILHVVIMLFYWWTNKFKVSK